MTSVPPAGSPRKDLAGRVTIAQLMAVRRLLEVTAAGEAARHRSDDHLAELRAVEFDPHESAAPAIHSASQDFHLVMLRATGNPLLEAIAVPLFQVQMARFGRRPAPDGFWTCVADDHAELYDLIAGRDVDGAIDAMARHLDHLATSYAQIERLARPGRTTAPSPA